MRRRSETFVLLGTAFFGLALHSVIRRFPREPCTHSDCSALFGLLPEMTATILGNLCLAVGTFGWIADRRQAVRLAWYPAWGVLCWSVIGAYLAMYGPGVSATDFWYPIVIGGAVGVGREVRSW